MQRLQTKCFIVSGGIHLLLAIILLVGPAFLSSRAKPNDLKTLDFIPAMAIDENFAGGGNPNAHPAPAAPTPPAPPVVRPIAQPPAPQRETIHQPELPTPTRTSEAAEPDRAATKPPKKEFKLTPVKNRTTTENSHEKAEADRQAREYADAQRRAADAVRRAARSLSDDLSPSTSIEDPGIGGGGPSYANYGQIVASIYQHAWIAPDDAANDSAVTKVSITIARDGTVTSSHVVRGSGEPSVDGSVRRTLQSVTFIMPFPEGSKDQERTYIINFNLKAKRLSG